MKWLIKALSSSVGKKFVMGITGLLLCGFLVGHLGGNLLLLVGADAFNDYAHMLHSQKLLPLIEAGLAALFVAHIVLAFVTAKENRAARKVAYERTQSKQDDMILSMPTNTWMFGSGAVVLGFMLLHLVDMKFELRPDLQYEAHAVVEADANDDDAVDEDAEAHDGMTPYQKTVMVLENPISAVVYFIGVAFLGLHLSHGFSSAFQSLGINHPKYNRCIKICGIAFACVIFLGFACLPFWAWAIAH